MPFTHRVTATSCGMMVPRFMMNVTFGFILSLKPSSILDEMVRGKKAVILESS